MPQFDHLNLTRRWSLMLASDFDDRSVPEQYPPDLELEPTHLDINLHVQLAEETVSGTVTTTVVARRDGPSDIELNAVDFLDVEVGDADGRELASNYDGRTIKIHWAEPFTAGEERRVAVSYRVVKPVDGLYFSQPDKAYPERDWYVATDHETERARHWLPCIDLPNVRTTLDFHLRAEDRFTILANGLLLDETPHRDGSKTAHWRLEQRCPSYLVCFTIGDFTRADDGHFNDGEKQIELAYFSNREHDEATLLRSFGRTRAMMAWMTNKLGMPFPYPKYYQFALPAMWGAMENISLVSWGDFAMLSEETAAEESWIIDQINLHEMAHSYFGDAVVVRDFAHAWLKESWATYMEQCWSQDVLGQEEGDYVFYDHAQAYFKEADDKYQRPIVTRRFKSSWQMYDRHLYPGGACRLHTLRRELGDDTFWTAVHDYLESYSGQVVETDDFRHVMEKHSGRALGKFFDQWFSSKGYPDIKVSFKYDEKKKQGVFEVEQQQVDAEKGIPAFELSTDLGWTIDGESDTTPVKLSQARHIFVVPMSVAPEQVRFDPGNKILHKLSFNPGDPMLRKQLTEAKDVIGRIQAAHELAKSGKRANVQAIIDAYDDEPYWGARVEFARALSKAGSEASIVGLARVVTEEEDPVILPFVLEAAAEYRDNRIRDAVAERLKNGLAPFARARAYEAMGAQRAEADYDLLLQGSRETGYHGIAQAGAFRGLAATRRQEATAILLDQVGYGKLSNRVRPTVAGALGDIGKGLEKAERERVRETLEDLLRDPQIKVQYRAGFALVDMLAVEAVPALEAYRNGQAEQNKVLVDKLIAGLRSQDKVDGSAVKKQVEGLEKKVRQLAEQLQQLEAQVSARTKEEEDKEA
ncbi:MAG: M1 family aminopeptidase [Chloroflexota bacterium]|jgi:aminopeptidase N